MRIFYAVPDSPNVALSSRLWRANLHDPLVDLGHELVEFTYDYTEVNQNLDTRIPEQREFVARNRPRFSEELLRQVRAAHQRKPLELFFSYFYSTYVEPAAVREIGAMGITTANWFCNASYQFNLVEEIAPAYHFCLVPERFRLEDYRRVGANPIYCQEAANPAIYRPHDVPLRYDATFVGQRYGTRPMYLRRLLDAGVDVRVWGALWDARPPLSRRLREAAGRLKRGRRPIWQRELPADRCGPPLPDDELVRMYSRSRISLGFTSVAEIPQHGEPIKQVRLRDFEAPMSGAFYLVEYVEELTEFFEPDREIVCFGDAGELADKARHYLRNDAERERIRRAGHERCTREHTWHKRFETVFREMGLR